MPLLFSCTVMGGSVVAGAPPEVVAELGVVVVGVVANTSEGFTGGSVDTGVSDWSGASAMLACPRKISRLAFMFFVLVTG